MFLFLNSLQSVFSLIIRLQYLSGYLNVTQHCLCIESIAVRFIFFLCFNEIHSKLWVINAMTVRFPFFCTYECCCFFRVFTLCLCILYNVCATNTISISLSYLPLQTGYKSFINSNVRRNLQTHTHTDTLTLTQRLCCFFFLFWDRV